MLSFEFPTEYLSPLAGVPPRASGSRINQSRPAVVASGTLDGGVNGVNGTCLFNSAVNVVDRRDVSLLVCVDFAALGVTVCRGAIGSDGVKMCVRPLMDVSLAGVPLCNIAKHRTTPALFMPKNISPTQVYVLISIHGKAKNEVWLTTSAPIKKVGERFERSWKHDD